MMNDILEKLRKPGRDPRDQFVASSFNEQFVKSPTCKPVWCWKVWSPTVTKFGALATLRGENRLSLPVGGSFVDIGVHQDGLVHIALASRCVKDPSLIVRVGQIVKVKVLSMEPKTNGIALSVKAMQDPSAKTFYRSSRPNSIHENIE